MDWTHQEAQAVWVADGREGQDARIFPKIAAVCFLPADRHRYGEDPGLAPWTVPARVGALSVPWPWLSFWVW